MPALGVLSPLWNNLLDSLKNDTSLPFAMTVICSDFPYTFYYLVTTTIAVDRFFIVTRQKKYEIFVTIKRLVYIVILLLVLAFVNCFVLYYVIPLNYGNVKSTMRKTYLIVNIIVTFCSFFVDSQMLWRLVGILMQNITNELQKRYFTYLFVKLFVLCHVLCILLMSLVVMFQFCLLLHGCRF